MTAHLRMIRIEFRRSLGLWLLLPMIGLACYVAWFRTTESQTLVLWPEVSVGIKNSTVFLGPLLGGLAAWMAGRNKRRGIEELLQATSRPPAIRELALFSGTVLWGGLAYVLTALVICLIIFQRGTWGVPDVSVILLGLLGIGTAGALGYAAGYFAHFRFVAPLVAVVLFLAQQTVAFTGSSLRYLSPVDWSFTDVFYGVPDFGLLQALWLVGLAAVALTAVAFKGRRSALTGGAVLAALAIAAAGAVPLLLTDIQTARAEWPVLPYEPVCQQEGALPVCVHPAYRDMLSEAAPLVERVAAPLAGIPGGPVRAGQRSIRDQGFSPDGTLAFELHNAQRLGLGEYLADNLARALAVDQAAMSARADGGLWTYTDAQQVLLDWLMMEAGFSPILRADNPEERATLERFAALDPGVRRAWLVDNYAALRVGELTLEELP